MNSTEQAELQRKLSMGAVPRPPADLAERIKADIPKYLEAHPAPRRSPWALPMQIAASILLLFTSVLVTREVMKPRYDKSLAATAEREKLIPPVNPPQRQSAPEAAVTASPGETEVTLDVAQEIPRSAAPVPTQVAQAAPPQMYIDAAVHEAQLHREESDSLPQARRLEGTATLAAGVSHNSEPAPLPAPPAAPTAPPPPPPPPAMATAPAESAFTARREAGAEKITVTASAPSIVPEAYAGALDLNPSSVFGISVDPRAFTTVRSAIENGSRPAAATVDVEALVNYFAGEKKPSRDVSLEVEASPAPIAADGDRAILRFTVDTARMTVAERASVPPVARDAHLHVDIDPRTVASFRRIGDDGSVQAEEALLYNTSVTGLYELQLKPNLRRNQRVATIVLKYVSIKTGRPVSVAKVVHFHDLTRRWDLASRRHRLAALGALWSETLRGTGSGREVAKRAEELATQNPRDERARELADAASASTEGSR
jgi:hypothetical protein